jgi:hypothetical protein
MDSAASASACVRPRGAPIETRRERHPRHRPGPTPLKRRLFRRSCHPVAPPTGIRRAGPAVRHAGCRGPAAPRPRHGAVRPKRRGADGPGADGLVTSRSQTGSAAPGKTSPASRSGGLSRLCGGRTGRTARGRPGEPLGRPAVCRRGRSGTNHKTSGRAQENNRPPRTPRP